MRRPLLVITVVGLAVLVILPIVLSITRRNPAPLEGFRGIKVLMPSGKVETLQLEDYLVGVVAAEMPAQFEPEALKAQAVAARTYAVRKLAANKGSAEYDVDTTERSQAWISDQQMRSKWGVLRYLTNRNKVANAVQETKGCVLAFEGAYVQAFYFSSAGRLPTEKAEEVWGASLPYLTNIDAEEGELGNFVVRTTLTAKELDAKLGTSLAKNTKLKGSDVTITERTAAGRAKTVKIGSKTMQATQFRTQLALKSTDFTLSIEKNQVVITSYGNGHAVGMSQYGANALAKKGVKFPEILGHYYPGTELLNIDQAKD
ncbi:MAG TPA: stage II sporulation protein D [Verrucomicrobiae bacterium]|nr:stage II sporulation protein D [Verrucomicrobiae bacterium]